MVRLDSVKLLVLECLKSFSEDVFLYKPTYRRDELISVKYELDVSVVNVIGLKSLVINGDGSVILELSAKFLREKYFDGINLNVCERLVDFLNRTGFVEFDKQRFFENAFVLRCDVADNLRVSKDVSEYIKALKLCKVNARYDAKFFDTSVVYKKRVKYKERMIFYDKYTEILKDKCLLSVLDEHDLRKFEGVLRCEQNLTTFQKMREALDICGVYLPDLAWGRAEYVRLLDVLSSQKKVNFDLFNRIVEDGSVDFVRRYGCSGLKLSDIERRIGRIRIIAECEYSRERIVEFLKSHLACKNLSNYKKKYFALLDELKREGYAESSACIEEIRHLLRTA